MKDILRLVLGIPWYDNICMIHIPDIHVVLILYYYIESMHHASYDTICYDGYTIPNEKNKYSIDNVIWKVKTMLEGI